MTDLREKNQNLSTRLVYGCAKEDADPAGVAACGRIVKTHVLDLPMRTAGLHEKGGMENHSSPTFEEKRVGWKIILLPHSKKI